MLCFADQKDCKKEKTGKSEIAYDSSQTNADGMPPFLGSAWTLSYVTFFQFSR